MVKRLVNVQRLVSLLCVMVLLLTVVGRATLTASADGLPAAELQALNQYPNWVADNGLACGGGLGSTLPGTFGYGSASATASVPKSLSEITNTPSTDTNATDANAKIVYQYFIGKGLTANEVVGILGNMAQESHFRADNSSESSTWGQGGYGLTQWTDIYWPQPGRRTRLVNAMTRAGIGNLYNQAWDSGKTGLTPASQAGILLGFELDYLWYELNGPYKSTLDALKSSVTYQDATTAFYAKYEGIANTSDPSLQNRINDALKYLKMFNGLGGLTGGGGLCTTSTAGASGWDISGLHAMVTYEQYDPKYANQPYGVGTIADCGCGPTSMAMAIATLTGDSTVTPPVVAAYYAAHGGQAVPSCASTWNWKVLSQRWPLIKIVNIGSDLQRAAATIQAGGLVLVSYTGPPFTGSTRDSNGNLPGHIFLIRATAADGGFYIANPLGHYAGSVWAKQNTTDWSAKYFSTSPNDIGGPGQGGYLNNMWSITKV